MASRTFRFFMAPPESGLCRLNTRYGNVLLHGQMWNLGLLLASMAGMDAGSKLTSWTRSYVPALSSASWVVAEVTPMVSWILLTYWCRIESLDCFQAGLRSNDSDLPGTFEVISYWPS